MKTDFLLYRHPDALPLSFQGAAFTCFLIIMSALNLAIAQSVISLVWLPLIGVFLWPRWSHPALSVVFIALLGLFADLLLGRILGISSLLYLVLYWTAKPREREFQLGLFKGWLEFSLIACLLLVIGFYILGRTLDLAASWRAITEQLVVTIAFFPVIFALRVLVRRWIIDPDDANYQS